MQHLQSLLYKTDPISKDVNDMRVRRVAQPNNANRDWMHPNVRHSLTSEAGS